MLLAFALCCTTCYGMEFVDTFSSTQNTDAASYQNLVTRSGDPMDDFNWPAAQDQTFAACPPLVQWGQSSIKFAGRRL